MVHCMLFLGWGKNFFFNTRIVVIYPFVAPAKQSPTYNGNNLMTLASKLKVDRGIPGEPILYLSGKYHM